MDASVNDIQCSVLLVQYIPSVVCNIKYHSVATNNIDIRKYIKKRLELLQK